MKTAFVIYDGMTVMDFVGVYDALIRLKNMGFKDDYTWDVCALSNTVTDGSGLQITANRVAPDLSSYELLVLPGGHSAGKLMNDPAFLDWLRTFNFDKGIAATVCSASLFLGVLGLIKGKRATSHRRAFEALRPFCREVVDARVVDEGRIITARGVTSSLFLGLHLCRRIAGDEVARKIATQIDAEFALEGSPP